MKNAIVRVLGMLGLLTIVLTFQSSNANPIDGEPAANQPAVAHQTGGFNQAKAVEQLKAEIAGKENQPAEQVFKNIKMFKGMAAGRVLAVMQFGYSKALGVDCTHCHVAGEWEKEEKPTKQITREMSDMAKTINTKLLKEIKNLKSPNPIVNCTTCHRGQVKPALDLP